MQLIDNLTIKIQSGAGGNGVVSFKKIRNNMRGIPDGGNGGAGGNIYLTGDRRHDDLRHLVGKRFYASSGKNGRRTNKTGENGGSLTVSLPFGTRVLNDNHLLFEISNNKQHLVARGGRGGLGNAGSQRQRAGQGQPGVQLNLHLDFRLTVDIALVGLANSGKSSLLAQLTTAKPTIAPYPFTTTTPQIGVCQIDGCPPLTIVEIPAINRSKTLKHLLNCKVIVYVVANNENLESQLSDLRKQLVTFNEGLAHKHELVVVNTCNDTPPALLIAGKRIVSLPPDREILKKTFTNINVST